jgi:hypothetical protein
LMQTETEHQRRKNCLLKNSLHNVEFKKRMRYEIHHNQHYERRVCNFSSSAFEKSGRWWF